VIRTRRDRGGWRPPAFVMVTVAAYCALWLPQGFDVTDDGVHLADQQALLRSGGIPATGWSAMVWLSDVVGALWLLAAGSGLLVARIGWALVMVACAVLAWRILARAAAPWPAAWAVMLAAPMILAQGRTLIDYNRVPILFMLLAIDAMTAERDDRRRTLRDVLAGAFLALAALARAASAPAVLLLFVPMLGPRADGTGGRIARGVAGCAAVLVALAGWLAFSGRVEAIRAVVGLGDVRESHGLASLLGILVRDWGATIVVAALTWALVRVSASATTASRAMRTAGAASTLVVVTGLVVLLLVRWGVLETWRAWSQVLVGLCVGVLFTLAKPGLDQLGRRRYRILTLGIIAALLSFLASNSGLVKVSSGLWLALPAALLHAWEVAGRGGVARTIVGALVVALAVCGAMIRTVSPYRDAPDRRQLVAAIEHERLRGIRTTPERARTVSELLAELKRRVRPGDVLLAYGGIPMVHPLTDTVPALGHAWPDVVLPAEMLGRLASLGRDRPLPALAVASRVNTESADWGDPVREAPAPAARLAIFDDWLRTHGYAVVWSNREFRILAPGAIK
jgi:hypothetical protein